MNVRSAITPLLPGLILAGLLLAGCSKKETGETLPGDTPEVQSGAERGEAQAPYLPQIGSVEGYAGSSACQSCHESEYESWHRSYHRTMTQLPRGDAVKADFHGVVLTNERVRFTLRTNANEYWVRMEHVGRPEAGGMDVPLGLVTGSHHMQVFWVPEGHGNLQIGFPFTWLIPEQRWVPRHMTFVRPPDMQHSPELWNLVCSRCHTTGVQPHADVSVRRFETEVAELGISCEACHGPARNHVDVRRAAIAGSGPEFSPTEIVQPRDLSAVRASQVCGFCHSMKWIDQSSEWREKGFAFRPGDDLEETTPIIRPSKVQENPGLADYLRRHPDLLDDFFWPDGMVRVSGREYNGLIESPCYKGNQFSCLSCHSLHKSDPDDQLSHRGKSSEACLQCHENFRQTAALTAHTHHLPNSSGSDCYNCHMPHTTYGVLKAIRSHEISSPSVAKDLETGRPNACNLCHLDQPLSWTASYLEKWFGQAPPVLPETATEISHAVRLAISGDAGQRALLAWHFGWEPAQQASGTNWLAPHLGQLLDDPYAAVRLVAERSLGPLGMLPQNYDFTADLSLRKPFRDIIWALWREQADDKTFGRDRSQLLRLWPENQQAQKEAFENLIRVRDNDPIRLRE